MVKGGVSMDTPMLTSDDVFSHTRPSMSKIKRWASLTFMEKCMSSDLSPHRTHSTIPFHHSSPVIVDYVKQDNKWRIPCAAGLGKSRNQKRRSQKRSETTFKVTNLLLLNKKQDCDSQFHGKPHEQRPFTL